MELIPDTFTPETLLALPTGTRVRWNDKHTHFGRVLGRHPVSGLLSTQEENGPVWALSPETDHITVLSAT